MMRQRLFLLLMLVGLCSFVPGCGMWDRIRGENFSDRDAQWGETLRPQGPAGELFGFSERARQIERNVGVR